MMLYLSAINRSILVTLLALHVYTARIVALISLNLCVLKPLG